MAADPTTVAARWRQNLSAAGPKITEGVDAVRVAPGMAASRQKDVWVQNTTAAQNKWAANTAAVPLESWRSDMKTKGIPRIATGAVAAEPRFATFMGKLLPFIETNRAQLPARGGLEQNIARSADWIRRMASFTA